ncbi:MAG: hypothetical protein COV76_06735 [Candidatus Omnitrophica bacterium CG11_big_fil_rev_8_21_14_0_20_64_10]|nr:MAG: hypothetical protein COV76_06735 [Candidatus Omnitrophica bacterium CG11_big_fil_rev_8_21_14_0_20_64_10]
MRAVRCIRIPDRGEEPLFGMIMEILLKTRVKLGLPSDAGGTEEAVNTYLGGLMTAYLDPAHWQAVRRVVTPYEVELFEAIERCGEEVQAYRIYKANADDLLMQLGIFNRSQRLPFAGLQRIRHYYRFAAECQRRIYRRPTAISDVQERISRGPERYLGLLSELRGRYLRLADPVDPAGFEQFGEALRDYERELPLKAKQDQLLDAYLNWRKAPWEGGRRQRLDRLVRELQALDPVFHPEFFLDREAA